MFETPDVTIRVDHDLAMVWGIDRIAADGGESRSRATRVFQCRDGDWHMIHQHLSVPAEPAKEIATEA